MKNAPNAIDPRPYKYKKAATRFFCPLCRTERAFVYSPRLSAWHYMQIALITATLMAIFFPIMGVKSFVFLFIVWAGFELAVRFLFKREVPCPYCGFDATWYKRDVRVAKQKVHEFWMQKGTMPLPSQLPTQNQNTRKSTMSKPPRREAQNSPTPAP